MFKLNKPEVKSPVKPETIKGEVEPTKPEVKSTKPSVEKVDGKSKSITIKPILNAVTGSSFNTNTNPTIVKEISKNDSKKRPDMVITDEMITLIDRASMLVGSGQSKSSVAREVFDKLSQCDRRQIIHVFIKGCGLTKAGAGKYYQNLKKPSKSK